MNYRRGVPTDAEEIAALIASFQKELTDDPSGVGAEHYLRSVSDEAERSYLMSDRYVYTVAIDNDELAGFIAIRDRAHVFHLFVARSHQRRGLARQLWKLASVPAGSASVPGTYTVNSSLNAVPVYRSFGFVPTGEVTQVHGISYLPMKLNAWAR
jgi:ribosomal protein S18 acetylase RimI-like enzyme